MKTKLSELMDGEIAEHEVLGVYAALRQDEALRSRWLEYQLIGDTLKGEKDLGTELTGRVMAALDAEPTVLAPRSAVRQEAWRRHSLALAATVAGVTVVGWLAFSNQPPQTEVVAQAPAPATLAIVAKNDGASANPAALAVRQASPDMQEYLIAHEAQSSLLQFRGGAEHIRTVAAIGMARSK